MKKIWIYILLPVLMFNSSLNELFKLPVLFSHFMEHRALDDKIDLIDFLSMHYFGNDLNDDDQDRDMQLPFKKPDLQVAFQVIAVPVTKPVFEKRQVFFIPKLPLAASQDFNLSDPSLGCLFRPPIS